MKKAPTKMMGMMGALTSASVGARKKSPAKKPLVGKQDRLPENLKKEILAATKMKKAAMKMKKESAMMLKKSAMKMKKATAMKMKMKKK